MQWIDFNQQTRKSTKFTIGEKFAPIKQIFKE